MDLVSTEFLKDKVEKISKQAKGMAEIILLPNGVQAKIFNTKVICTFYYKQKKYHLNISNIYVNFTPGNEMKVISKYYKKQNHVTNFTGNTPAYVATPINKPVVVKEVNDKGTEACINHLKKKYAFMEANQADNKLLAMIKSLIVELEQYL